MNSKFLDKKILFSISMIAVVIIVFTILLPGNKTQTGTSPANQPTPTPIPVTGNRGKIKPINVIAYSPDKAIPLKPGTVQSFTAIFEKPTDISKLKITLTKSSLDSSQPATTVPSTISLSPDKKLLTLKPSENIDPLTKYNFSIFFNNQAVFSATYLSDDIEPTGVKTNNDKLIHFLPYVTSSYKLSYLPNRNIYIFNFIYDPNSSNDIQTQYDKAKADATEFIQSKGIDINTIVIEWRHS